ncbi:MAG: hypothetical protein HYS18_07985 [Burkholderiales bacterium]|nr:hypothetical protein [Burkholderiales bacterium]
MSDSSKVLFDRRTRLRPSSENRHEAVDRIIWGLKDYGVINRSSEVTTLNEIVSSDVFVSPNVAMFHYAFELGLKGVNEILTGDEQGWKNFALGASYAFWGQVGNRCSRITAGATYSDPMSAGDVPTFYWLFAMTSCPEKIARPWGHYFYNMFAQQGIKNDIGDNPMFHFCQLLLKSYCERRWFGQEKVGAELEGFAPLLRSIDTELWESALLSYCDYRLSRAYEFPNAEALKAKPGAGYFFNRQWFAIFPLELLALKNLYESLAGGALDLQIEHPLLRLPLICAPRIVELPQDELLQKLIARSMANYGDLWQPYSLIDLIA